MQAVELNYVWRTSAAAEIIAAATVLLSAPALRDCKPLESAFRVAIPVCARDSYMWQLQV